jgi:hypothetical protein
MAQHPDALLSAYVDAALSREERLTVEAHLHACEACRSDIEQLQGVRSLLANLPERAPRRSLVARQVVPAWFAPARWLSSVAAAVFALVFVVSSSPVGAPATSGFGRAEAPAAAPAPAEEFRDTNQLAISPTPAAAPRSPATASPDDLAAKYAVSPTPQRVSPAPRGDATADRLHGLQNQTSAPPSWVWLIAAIVAGAIALALQMRIARRT